MASFQERIAQLKTEFLQSLHGAVTVKDLEAIHVRFLGKKGPLQALMAELRHASAEERPLWGKWLNECKEECASYLERTRLQWEQRELDARLLQEREDVTLPGRRQRLGRMHPVVQMLRQATDILSGMGFSVQLGPDIDSDYYNFEGLNFPPGHPARDMQDTFYVTPDLLLRTHTSNVQVHVFETSVPPIRIIAPGRCFRNEDVSPRSHVFFHQIEGLYVDRHVTFADLLATMEEFWHKLLGEKVEVRFRPSYFPFVEPGMEVDVRCTSCKGNGCRLCKQSGWLEVCGAGMVHPHVLEKGGIDPEKYSGYAWGMGIERLTMLRYGITDIRLFTENDLRFLEQFA